MLTAEDLWQACREQVGWQLGRLAQRLTPCYTWDDIVLPDDLMRQLREIADQVAARPQVYESWGFGARLPRGRGISALFSGPSGTGKTMAAEILANHLQLDLYRIDLAGVVSKYIGETEKNLRNVFDAAEQSGAILFFDEADALFGKRSEVKDSHDRYANIEVNYLLQRMEDYRGLAILCTNRRAALDRAFLRRLRFLVEFPFPDGENRCRIWQKVFPPQAPLASLDLEALSRLEISRGQHPQHRIERRVPRRRRRGEHRDGTRAARGPPGIRQDRQTAHRGRVRPLLQADEDMNDDAYIIEMTILCL